MFINLLILSVIFETILWPILNHFQVAKKLSAMLNLHEAIATCCLASDFQMGMCWKHGRRSRWGLLHQQVT
jgi:hypothetical protein